MAHELTTIDGNQLDAVTGGTTTTGTTTTGLGTNDTIMGVLQQLLTSLQAITEQHNNPMNQMMSFLPFMLMMRASSAPPPPPPPPAYVAGPPPGSGWTRIG